MPQAQAVMKHKEEKVGASDVRSSSSPHQDVPQVNYPILIKDSYIMLWPI